jgi:[protein-PII] uridylyltransferase
MKAVQAEVGQRLAGWSEAEKEEHFARGYAPTG